MGRIANTLAKQGFIAPFGDSPTVGIGGITLGGGIGPLQRTIGLISDNLLEVEMVDANGKVIGPIKIAMRISFGPHGEVAVVTSEHTPATNSKCAVLQRRLLYSRLPGHGLNLRRYSKHGKGGLPLLIRDWAGRTVHRTEKGWQCHHGGAVLRL